MINRIEPSFTRHTVVQKPRTRLARFLAGTTLVLAVLQVIVSNRLATTGLQIAQIEQEIQTVAEENTDLRQQIASASALLTLQKKAKELGFVEKAQAVYIGAQSPVALDLQ